MGNNNPFLNLVCLILGGSIVWGMSTHVVGDSAVSVCDFIHKFQHNFIFELAIVLIIALLLWGLYTLWLMAMPVVIGLLITVVLAFVFMPDLNKSYIHINPPEDKQEKVYGG